MPKHRVRFPERRTHACRRSTPSRLQKLSRLVGTPKCPAIVDVRTDDDFAADPRLIPGLGPTALRRRGGWAPALAGSAGDRRLPEGPEAQPGRRRLAPTRRRRGRRAGGRLRRLARRPACRWSRPTGCRRAMPTGRTVWVTRARPKVDRIACPWLIRRFVDPRAVFLFVAPSEVAAVAERFGADAVRHRGRVLVPSRRALHLRRDGRGVRPRDRAARSGSPTIVRGADTARPDLAPQAAGLLAVSLGLSRLYSRRPRAARGRAWRSTTPSIAGAATRPDETHNWPTGARRRGRERRAEAVAPDEQPAPAHPAFAEATKVWATIGLLSFGGPAGQIALMHRMLVEERNWIAEPRFLHALNYCMLLPGPEAQQLATYVGWLLHGTRGGLVAGTLFVLPGFVVILALSALYVALPETGAGSTALFFGLKAAVLAIVIEAVLRIGRRALKTNRAVVDRGRRLRRDLRPRRAVSADRPRRRRRRLCRRPRRAASAGAGPRPGRGARPDAADAELDRVEPTWRRALTVRWPRWRSGSAPAVAARARSSAPTRLRADRAVLLQGWRSSPSAAPMRCSPMSPSGGEDLSAGSTRARCSTASAWPRPRPGR